MSYIPSSAMKHAGPTHHADAGPSQPAKRTRPHAAGLGTGTWIAIGGTVLASAAAIAVPLLRRGKAKPAARHGKKTSHTRRKAGERKKG
ncbi:hypothetical protein [uncultured Sphingomonas sp.]|uniref:hypothetical protein n=1 Tax=uncultured Sphingomonas sp. TaxID=158754 RepID=UPI002596D29C|nr:hypothetical protein [uncultured Sphingomonas sp.]